MPTDANQVSLYYVAEDTFNETPDGSKALQELGYIPPSDLKIANQYQDSEEVRSDRQLAAQPKVGEESSAAIQTELSMRALNDFFAACLGSTWTTVSPGALTVSCDDSSETLTTAGSFTPFALCRYIKIAGSATAANNGIKKVVSVTSTVITLAAGSLTADTTDETLTITGKYVRVGQTLTTFMLEQKFALMDAGANRFKRLSGAGVNEISLDVASKSRVKATVNFMAATGAYSATTSGDGTPLAKTALPIITTNANVATIYRGGTAIAVPVQSLPLSIKNNLRIRPALGVQNTLEFGLNEFDLSGTINAYFSDKALVDEMVAGTVSSLEFALTDSAGKLLNFYMPLAKILTGDPNPSNKNSDVMTALAFRALGSDSAKVLQLDYLEA